MRCVKAQVVKEEKDSHDRVLQTLANVNDDEDKVHGGQSISGESLSSTFQDKDMVDLEYEKQSSPKF